MRDSTDMAWETPSPPRSGIDWVEVARTLRARPNEWLRINDRGPTSVVNAVRGQSISAITPVIPKGGSGGFEVKTRNNTQTPPRVATLYLRYVPERES